jgi:hypothetical protein
MIIKEISGKYYIGRKVSRGFKDSSIFIPRFHQSGKYVSVRVSVGIIDFPEKFFGKKFRLRVEWLDEKR